MLHGTAKLTDHTSSSVHSRRRLGAHVHASAAHHPNQRVREYIYPGGYRFYGVVGSLVVLLNFSPQMSKWVPGVLNFGPLHLPMFWPLVWVLSMLVIIPLGVRDILRANRDNWQDMTVEVEEHA